MDGLVFWQTLWFFILILLFFIYSLLDGFDLGIGILLPFFSRKENSASRLLKSVTPFWDGNELWLLNGAVCVFAVFPPAFRTVLSGFYLPVILLALFFILRAVSFEFYFRDIERRQFWGVALAFCSFMIVFMGSLTLANLTIGIPLDGNGEFKGNILSLFRIFPAIIALLAVTAAMLHGMSYAAGRTDGGLKKDVLKVSTVLCIVLCAGLILFVPAILIFFKQEVYNPGIWAGLLISFLALLAFGFMLRKGWDKLILWMSSLFIAGLWIAVASAMFPNLIRAGNNPANSITIYNASSPLSTLTFMTYLLFIGIILILLYTLTVYRIFRGRTKDIEDY